MFDNVTLKVKNEKLTMSAIGMTGKEKICTIDLVNIDKIDWAKDTRKVLVQVLIEKGYGELAVKLANRKIEA